MQIATTASYWFVYILECADGTLYTGISTDMERRCSQHNAGTGARYTRSRLPVKIVYFESCGSQSEALKREAAIKAYSRTEKLNLIRSTSAAPIKFRSPQTPQ